MMNDPHKDYQIEYPIVEGTDILGECEGQFILWHKKDIIIETPSPACLALDQIFEDLQQAHSPVREDIAVSVQAYSPPQHPHAPELEPASVQQEQHHEQPTYA